MCFNPLGFLYIQNNLKSSFKVVSPLIQEASSVLLSCWGVSGIYPPQRRGVGSRKVAMDRTI